MTDAFFLCIHSRQKLQSCALVENFGDFFGVIFGFIFGKNSSYSRGAQYEMYMGSPGQGTVYTRGLHLIVINDELNGAFRK